MSEAEQKKPTALQANHGFTAADDYNTRTHILPLLLDAETRARIIAEHRANPFGAAGSPEQETPIYSADLARVIDKLRVQPTARKLALYCREPEGPFRLVLLPGARGEPVEFLDAVHDARADAEHEIFRRRLRDLLSAYGHDDAAAAC